jgi:hypothetical protein
MSSRAKPSHPKSAWVDDAKDLAEVGMDCMALWSILDEPLAVFGLLFHSIVPAVSERKFVC